MNINNLDFAGIGIGPFNLSLAALVSNQPERCGRFFDLSESFNWHPGMMLESATLQTPFLSDLVTLADPTHPLSFLNYVKQSGRLYSFYIRENFFLMRSEYNQYCQWVSEQLDNVQFSSSVERVEFDEKEQCYRLFIDTSSSNRPHRREEYTAKKIVIGTGPKPWLPDCCVKYADKITHSSRYLQDREKLKSKSSITIVGSGQSAAEIFYDLLSDIECHGYELNWITRAPRFFPLEYSKLTLEMTSPEYVDYFYQLPVHKKEQLLAEQKHLYKGINSDLINAIFDLLYIKQLNHSPKVNLITNSELYACQHKESHYQLKFHQVEQNVAFECSTQGLVLASGYRFTPPDCLQPILNRIAWTEKGEFDVSRYYAIDKKRKEIFVQNAELHSHGFVTPDLGMACYRNSHLIKQLYGKEIYPIETDIAFQTFSPEQIDSSSFIMNQTLNIARVS